MSRRENKSLLVRGVPRQVLSALERTGNKNLTALQAIGAYAAGTLTPTSTPSPFDPARKAATPHGPDTANLSISGIDDDVFAAFMARAKREQWHSKNELIVALLRQVTAAAN